MHMMLGNKYIKVRFGGGYPTEHIIRFMARNYYSLERTRVKVLDFGCGAGAHTWYLAREGFDTYAFDISETAVKRLRNRLETEGLRANVIAADGMNMPYEDEFFDVIIDNVSILTNRISDIKIMYNGVYSKLKTSGKFITVVFGKETTGYGTGKEIEPGTYEGIEKGCLQRIGCRHFFEETELKEILQKIGFRNISVEFIFYSDRGNIVNQLVAVAEK